MKKKVFIFICIFSTYLSATPNLQKSDSAGISELVGILVRCAKKNLSYIKAIQLLQNGTIRKIRTENPDAVLFTYINKTGSSSAELRASEERSHTTAAKSDSPDSSMTISTADSVARSDSPDSSMTISTTASAARSDSPDSSMTISTTASAARSDSPDSSMTIPVEGHITNNLEFFLKSDVLPKFLRQNLDEMSEKMKARESGKITIYVPRSPIAKLTAFLFPMHNREFKANNITSCFLGAPYGPAIIKCIVNIFTSEASSDARVTDEEIVSQSIKIITESSSSSSKLRGRTRKAISEDIHEFLETLRDSIAESSDKDLPISILMSYLWEKSATYADAIEGLNIYPSTTEVAHTEGHRQEEPRLIAELKDFDPTNRFPILMEKVVLNTGKPHGDCAEVTVRNFLNLAMLNHNGSVKDEFHELVRNSQLLSSLYSLINPSLNLRNDIEKAQEWNNVLISIGMNCTESNPDTEMKAEFTNFIKALNVLLGLPSIAKSNLCIQFQVICQSLSKDQTIKWRRKSDAGGRWRTTDIISPDISNYDEIIFASEKDGKILKNFTIHQSCGHAYIA